MKILYTTTIGVTMIFFKEVVKELIESGNTVDIACNESEKKVDDFYRKLGCNVFQIEWERSPLSPKNVKAFRALKKIVAEGGYDVVHCHTPIAGVITRLVCKSAKKNGLQVFYTAHGFHFYRGAPLKNWLFYFPIEKACSRYTDVLITINNEDYELAKKRMKAKRVEIIPGVGIDVSRFQKKENDKAERLRRWGIPQDAFVLVSVGELNKNKNHQIVLRAIADMDDRAIHYVIAGEGPMRDELLNLARRLGIEERIHLPGYCQKVEEIYGIGDVDVFPSIREGFGLAAIEGMATGLPLICSDNRGTRCYAENGVNALVCYTENDYKRAIFTLKNDADYRKTMGERAVESVARFQDTNVARQMLKIYQTNGEAKC